jgi:hypothetical protein
VTKRHRITIPAARTAAIVDALVATYAHAVDQLAAAVRAYRDDREPLVVVDDARRDVIEAEDMLDAVGWERGPRPTELEVAGPTGTVRETLYLALLAAADGARAACRAYERGKIDRAALAAAVADVAGLHDLFAALEEADAPEAS